MSKQESEDKDNGEFAIREILNRVVDSVHKLDYEAVRDFIPDDGVYYGSAAVIARGYEELYEKQFSRVWPKIDEFTMVSDSMLIKTSGNLGWAICLFESSAPGPDGKPVERKVRMTFIFEQREDNWMMVHSHDSLYPQPPA